MDYTFVLLFVPLNAQITPTGYRSFAIYFFIFQKMLLKIQFIIYYSFKNTSIHLILLIFIKLSSSIKTWSQKFWFCSKLM